MSPPTPLKILVGVAGWSYPDWKGIVYPQPQPRGFDALAYLSEFVDLIEINSTYYHPGPAKNARSWARRVASKPGFKFTTKIWKRFTHERREISARDVAAARAVPEVLLEEGLLGAALIQFPWSFKNEPDNRRWIFKVADWLSGLPLALEVRHSSWDQPAFYRMLEDLKITWVNVDQPVIGASLGPAAVVTSDRAYVRLHGQNRANWFKEGAGRDARYDYLYTPDQLEPWRERIELMAGMCDQLYVVANNHYKGQALANVAQMKTMLGQQAPAPQTLIDRYPGIA